MRLTHALVEDASLRTWFLGLEELQPGVRQAAFKRMGQQMQVDGEDPELATAVAMLSHAEFYDAVMKAVRERCGL